MLVKIRKLILDAFPVLREIKRQLVWQPFLRDWARTAARLDQMPRVNRVGPTRHLLIVPSDPYFLVGSCGDQAMIGALVSVVRKINPDILISIVTATEIADGKAKEIGLMPVRIWHKAMNPDAVSAALEEISPDSLAAIGADVMDGYYNSLQPMQMTMFADLAVRRGARAAILGFSFNTSPPPSLRQAFKQAHPDVSFFVREQDSLERFTRFIDVKAELVADLAFLLKPAEGTADEEAVRTWVDDRHAKGDTVLAFNIHPMLIKDATQGQIDRLIHAGERVVRRISACRKVSWLILCHDFREGVGDDLCLVPLAERLRNGGMDNLFLPPGEHTAAEIKGMVRHADAVVTGRMHLAIGSLSMGLPILAITYQSKFAGLFAHFGLPEWAMVPPEGLEDTDAMTDLVVRFVENLDDLRSRVAENLPQVLAFSNKNFTFLQ